MSLKATYWFNVCLFFVAALATFFGVYKFWDVDRVGAYFLMFPGSIALATTIWFVVLYNKFWRTR